MPLRRVDDRTWVAGQIGPDDLEAARLAGVTLVICNRPDGEDLGQPSGTEVAGWARARGMDFVGLPIVGRPDSAVVEAVTRAREAARGGTLLYCRSGMRSVAAWALGERASGRDRAAVLAEAAGAGFDLSGLV